MKSVYLFYTKLRMYFTLLPIALVLTIAIINNDSMTNAGKLYPLIVACIGGIAFIIIYLIRIVRINTEEIRSIGPFSSKEFVTLNKDKTLVLTVRPRKKIKIEVNGVDDMQLFDWADEEDRQAINLYRDYVSGGVGTVKSVLRYFEVGEDDISRLTESDSASAEYDALTVTKSKSELGDTYSIYFKKTI